MFRMGKWDLLRHGGGFRLTGGNLDKQLPGVRMKHVVDNMAEKISEARELPPI
jgi:hypothetical protein